MSNTRSAEAERLDALHALGILDTVEDEQFEAVCRTARRLFGVPYAVVSLIDAERQWLKTSCAIVPREMPRSGAICDHTIRNDAVLVVPDASQDPRFADAAIVKSSQGKSSQGKSSQGLRFYAGAPLILRPGIRVGALCLLDTRPRSFSLDEEAALRDLAAIVVANLRLHENDVRRAREAEARASREAMIVAQACQLEARENELRSSNRLLNLAEEIAQIGHWCVSLADDQPVWSAGAYRIMGMEVHAPVPPLSESAGLYHEEDRARVVATVRAAIASATGYDYEARVVRPDGVVRLVSVRGICETDARGRTAALFGTFIDITDRREADEALARSETRYRELAEGLPLPVWTTRMSDGQSTFANASFKTYCGEIGLGRDARQDLNHPDDRPAIVAAWAEAVKTGTRLDFQSRIRRHDGAYRWHKIVMIPIQQADGAPAIEWLGTALDIDDIITSRQRLEETGDLLRVAQEAANAGAWDWNMRTGIATLAPECARIYGLAKDGPMSFSAAGVTEFIHPDDRSQVWDAIRYAVDTHTAYCAEFRVVCGPEERWMRAMGKVLYDGADRPYRLVGFSLDVTDRKRADAELQAATAEAVAARAEAERASEAKSDFLAAMSHEIRTPLNGILGYADLMLEAGNHGAEDRRRLELIHGSGSALLTVLNDILDVSKIEAGQLELDPVVFPLRDLADNAVAIVAGSALKLPLSLCCEIDPAIPHFAFGDENRVRQVLLNLLNNAVKFTPSGSVTLRVRHEGRVALGSGETGEAMRFEVIDTGIGIAPDQRERLFRRFSQVDGSISRRFGGSGLGLAICRDLVTMMGGEIGVDSREGVGSTFWFTLALPARQAMPAAAAPPVAVSGIAAAGAGATRKLRLLLVEDVKINQELARAVLEVNGYHVDVVDDGADAVAAVRDTVGGESAYDLVLMDVQMPGMDGLTATRRIRALGLPAADVPIVAMTANVLQDQVDELRRAGMDDHVGKPFKRAELYAKVDRWALGRAGATTAEAAASPSQPTVDRAILSSIQDQMGHERVRDLLALLERELGARFAVGAEGTTTGRAAVDKAAFDRSRLAHDAHAMVSAAGVLGFVGIADLCRKIEAACRAGEDVDQLMQRLATLKEQAIRDIRTLRAA